jgi:predicted ArsR family transcriptional regulator
MSASTRQLILTYLQQHSLASAQDLSESLLITRANAQYHLKLLLDDGLVNRLKNRIQPAAGREPILPSPRALAAITWPNWRMPC